MRGRTVVYHGAEFTRPMKDSVRESLFNILSHSVEMDDIAVLDLFSGTGSVTFEFASRGASSILSVEKNRGNVRIMKGILLVLIF